MLTLDTNKVDIWCVFLSQIHDLKLLTEYQLLLSNEEKNHINNYFFTQDRHRFLVTRVLVRTILSQYALISPTEWIFGKTPYGKPYIMNNNPFTQKISFNLSHSKDFILLGVTMNRKIGVDIENLCDRPAPLDLVETYFANCEIEFFQKLPLRQRSEYFFRYWTLKESYLKARGIGLSIPLNLFDFHLHKNSLIEVSMTRQLQDHPSYWKFWHFQPSPEHVASICTEKLHNNNLQLTFKKIIPLEREEIINYQYYQSI